MKKFIRTLCSMKSAIAVLLLLIIACVAGSVIPQQSSAVIYQESYSTFVYNLIMNLGLDDVFHCWWFIGLTLFLCFNLLGCNLLRFPQMIKQYQNYNKDTMVKVKPMTFNGDANKLLKSIGFRNIESFEENGKKIYYAKKNTIGCWGAWLTHLGMLVIIVGFALGQMYTQKYVVYGVPGESKIVEEINSEITIDSFEVNLREDETVEQYTSTITVKNLDTLESKQGTMSVNHPTTIDGMKFYQNSTGWASDVKVYKDDQLIQTSQVYAGEYVEVEDVPGLIVLFRSFYPDYVDANGSPATASSKLNNPGYLYMLYYQNQLLGMNVLTDGNKITIDQYSIEFENPKQYTLIQIKNDPYTWVAAIGGGILMVALYLSFYVQPQECLIEDDKIYSRSRKGGVLFTERIKLKINELERDN